MFRRPFTVVLAAVALAACSSSGDGTSGSTTTTAAAAGTSTTRGPATTTTAAADLAKATVKVEPVTTKLQEPTAIAWRTDDDHAYVAEQHLARVVRVDLTTGDFTIALDLHGDVSSGGEQGLLGLAFSPDGTRLYTDRTDRAGNTRIERYTVASDGTIDVASQKVLLEQDQPYPNHNGGQLAFGTDGKLYVAFGDGGAAGDPENRAQNRSVLLGKIVRLDPTTGESEVAHLGLRNPWRFSFDRTTHDLWIGDVGQGKYEEIDVAPAGSGVLNFGWKLREGFHSFSGDKIPGLTDPVFETTHDDGNCSIIGGFVYRGTKVPDLAGSYVFTDYCKGDLLAIPATGDRVDDAHALGQTVKLPTSFGEGPDGELYVTSAGTTLYRIVAG